MSQNKHLNYELDALMSDRFSRYSKYIIQERALPDVRDGLKPVQRRILYAMFKDGNFFDKAYRKSAKTVGLVIGNYHPHGDTSVYEAMVRMSQTWKMNVPMIDMQGNNGSIDDDPAAAMRYTEARLSLYAQNLLSNIDENTVSFTPNFDDTSYEPSVLPAGLPQLLINGSSGIAAGYATNIPPHNLSEIIDATIHLINHPKASLEDLSPFVLGPDFPTGGIVQGKEGILDAFRTGKGRVVIRAKTEIVQTKTIQQILITEIPYEVIKSNLVKKLDELRINKTLEALLDVRDESDRNGLRIVCDLKKDADGDLILNYLFKHTDLQVYFSYNMVTIINKRPKLSSLLNILEAFVEFRKDLVLKRSHFQKEAIEKRMHILEGLIKAISVLDEVIALIRSAQDKQDAKLKLMERFNFSEIQAEAIVNLRLYRLTNTDIVELKNELADLQLEHQTLLGIISSDVLLRNLLVKELKVLQKQFSTARKSIIEEEVSEIVINAKAMITNEKLILSLTEDGYIKRVSLRSYQSSESSVPTIKDGDRLIGVIEAETFDHLLFFTDAGQYGIVPLLDLEELKWKDLGNHLGKYIKLEGQQRIIAAFLVKDFNLDLSIVHLTKFGQIKRSPLNAFMVTRMNRSYDAISLADQDVVVACFIAYQNDRILLSSYEGYACVYKIDDVPEVNIKSKGVKALNLSKGDHASSACRIDEHVNSVLVLANNHQMKRIKLTDLSLKNRPAKGELLARKVKTNPVYIQRVLSVSPYEKLEITHKEENWIFAKDVPLMDSSASFSQGAKDVESAYLMRKIIVIEANDETETRTIEATTPIEPKLKTSSIEEVQSIAIVSGAKDLPKEVLEDDETVLNEVEFIHFDL